MRLTLAAIDMEICIDSLPSIQLSSFENNTTMQIFRHWPILNRSIAVRWTISHRPLLLFIFFLSCSVPDTQCSKRISIGRPSYCLHYCFGSEKNSKGHKDDGDGTDIEWAQINCCRLCQPVFGFISLRSLDLPHRNVLTIEDRQNGDKKEIRRRRKKKKEEEEVEDEKNEPRIRSTSETKTHPNVIGKTSRDKFRMPIHLVTFPFCQSTNIFRMGQHRRTFILLFYFIYLVTIICLYRKIK